MEDKYNKEKEIIEIMADVEHSRWAKWQEYLHSLCYSHKINSLNSKTKQYEDIETGGLVIPKPRVEHWEKEIATPYKDLTEKLKEYDRVEARKTIKALEDNGYEII